MAQRRRSGSPSVRAYRGPLFKLAHPVKYLTAEARLARRGMAPGKVAARVFSLDQVKAALRTQTVRVTAESRAKQAEAWRRGAAKKTAAAKRAQAVKKASQPKKQVAVRGKRGRFDGSKSMTDSDRAAYERALAGAVDPALVPRSPRGRR